MRDYIIDFNKIFEELKRNLYSFYLLYKDVKEKRGSTLPDFIDRGKAYNKLVEMELAEKIANKKHIHDDPYSITSLGKSFINELEEQFDCNSIFNNAPLDNKDNFDKFFINKFKLDYSNQSLDEILSLFIRAPQNKKIFRGGVGLTFLGYKKMKDDGKIFEYYFKFKIDCSRCHEEFIFEQEIKFNSEVYSTNPSQFESKCPKCGLKFHMDAYITNWWFDEE